MSKDFAPFLLTNFRAPPSLSDALRRSSGGNCEHPTPLKEPKNPKLDGSPNVSISIPGQGNKGSGGTNLTLAFDDFDKKWKPCKMLVAEDWVKEQLSCKDAVSKTK